MKSYKRFSIALITFAIISLGSGCKNESTENKQTGANVSTKQEQPANNAPKIAIPSFEADSAYDFVGKQVAFGPRTPGSPAQKACAEWMLTKLKSYCDTVYKQTVNVVGGDGKSLPCINLIGAINPHAAKRILLLTHWDSRPWADQDTKDKDKPILAADDAGSGVGVLLELARQLKAHKLPDDLGVDILLTDVEDYGRSQWGENSYCLGTQYWARHPHVANYKAQFGILLDMVGARGAQFPMEGFSSKYASDIQQQVWKAAADAGYSSMFPNVASVDITDDHVPVNEISGIKTVDIINLQPDMEHPFAPHWHTHGDVMNIIDKTTLKAVGQTLLQTLFTTASAQ